jgi:hypothetical protein
MSGGVIRAVPSCAKPEPRPAMPAMTENGGCVIYALAGRWSPLHGPELIDRYLQLPQTALHE